MNGYSINEQIACVALKNKTTPVKQYHNYTNSFLKPTDNQLLNEINNNLVNPPSNAPPPPPPPAGGVRASSQPDATQDIEDVKNYYKMLEDQRREQEEVRKYMEEQARREAEEKAEQREEEARDEFRKGSSLMRIKQRVEGQKDFKRHVINVMANHFNKNELDIARSRPLNREKNKKELTKKITGFDFEGRGFPQLRVDTEKSVDPKDRRKRNEKSVNRYANQKIAEANQRKANLVNKLVDDILQESYDKNHDATKISEKDVSKKTRKFIENLDKYHERMGDEVKNAYKRARLEKIADQKLKARLAGLSPRGDAVGVLQPKDPAFKPNDPKRFRRPDEPRSPKDPAFDPIKIKKSKKGKGRKNLREDL